MNAFHNFKKMLGLGRRKSREEAMAAFASRYANFKELLQANAELANIMSELENAQRGEHSIDSSLVREQVRRAILRGERMATCLNEISGNRQRALVEVMESLGKRIEQELEQPNAGDIASLTLPLSAVDSRMSHIVGGKNANLGELLNSLKMPIPRGFAITIKASVLHLMRTSGLFKNIHLALRTVDSEKPVTIREASARVQKLITEARVPEDVASELLAAWDRAFGSDDVLTALRSSAIAEDGVQSFAGQYLSILGVSRETLLDSFKQVVASLFSQRALAYRASHGYPLETSGMGLCCLEMVKARAAGVAFSRHPVDLRSNCVLINGLWGLGEMVVDGSGTPDQWLVSRANCKPKKAEIANKPRRMVLVRKDGQAATEVEAVPESLRDQPCLSDEQVAMIGKIALDLEKHYKYPQDLEWAIDQDDQIILLQTRPMGLDNAADVPAPSVADKVPLLQGADVAAKGVGCGPVMLVHPDEDMTHFPEGAVLLISHSSPNVMTAMRRAAAVIAETGSLTGHMASVCREFGVPTIMNLPGATSTLANGVTVTVDALSGRVFEGEVPELLSLSLKRRQPAVDSPTLAMLRRISPYILPLHLIDHQSALFAPANCTSLHDVMRYAHELSYSEMFMLSDSLADSSDGAVSTRLVCRVPLDLHIIDLGGGLADPEASTTTPGGVTSVPFRQVLEGMLNPEVQAKGPRPINMRGFLSVMGQSMIGTNRGGGERFGDRSYAIVSDRYLNFSSRIGYHYAILDTWCGETQSKNYIRFEFAGGAAGNVQRVRRVRCIGLILGQLGFGVEITGDRIRAKFQKYHKDVILSRLDQLGRLLIMTRQMDMLMVNDEAVEAYAKKFLDGEYH